MRHVQSLTTKYYLNIITVIVGGENNSSPLLPHLYGLTGSEVHIPGTESNSVVYLKVIYLVCDIWRNLTIHNQGKSINNSVNFPLSVL